MNKIDFSECITILRKYADWEKKMYECGFDMNHTPVGAVVDMLHGAMCDFDGDWSYDEKLEFDWVIEWVYSPDSPNFEQKRHGVLFDLSTAGALYDFLVFMNEHGWED
jgi:hypothetical protein